MQPILFSVPGLDWDVHAYAFFLGLALVVGWIVTATHARADRLPTQSLGGVYVLSVGAALFAARASWLLQHPGSGGGLATLAPDGLAASAGFVVGMLVSGLLVSRRKIPVSLWFDAAIGGFSVGWLLERLGAFFAGTDFGRYAPDLPFAVRFPMDSPVFAEHYRTLGSLLPAGATESLAVHPVQLYAVGLAGIGVVLVLQIRKRRSFSGQVFLAYAAYFLIARHFVEEAFRHDAANPVFMRLNPAQLVSALLVVGILAVYRARLVAPSDGKPRLWEGGPWTPGAPKQPSGGTGDAHSRSKKSRRSTSGKRHARKSKGKRKR